MEPSPRALLRDDVYIRIRDAIVDSSFLPGEQLRDSEIAQWLGVSRTPVREALLRLGQAGLVISEPGKSTVVASVDVRATRDAQAVVSAMYDLAIRQAIPLMQERDFGQMREANEKFKHAIAIGDLDSAISADDELHNVPVFVAANAAVQIVLEQFTPVLRRVERLKFSSAASKSSIVLHERLIHLCEIGDSDAAAEVSHETWHSLDDLIDLAEQQLANNNQSERKA
jgi:DNA-binding GntR family transcriptional regulator